MDFQYKTRYSYKSELAFLSVMTLIFGFCCLFLGYLILPVAAGFYAALLAFEKKESRVLSYIIPLALLVINIFVNGFCSLEPIGYVVVGAIIFVGYDKKISKASTVLFATVAVMIMMIASLSLLAFDELGTLKISAINDFYTDIYEAGKSKFVEMLTAFTALDDKGFVFYRYNPSEAVDIYNAFVYSLIPFSAIFALIVVGLAVRLFFSRTSKYNTQDERNVSWKFVTSPFLAYSYLVLLGFSLIPSSGIFAASISFSASIFMAVYFYIGICALYSFISHKKNGRFAVLIILLSMLFFSSYAPKIISFIGVFVNNAFYKAMNSERDDI